MIRTFLLVYALTLAVVGFLFSGMDDRWRARQAQYSDMGRK